MGNGHFLNGKKCENCGHSWWEFDQCCKQPSIKVNPNEIYRYGSNETIHEVTKEKPVKSEVLSLAEALRRGVVRLED